MKFTINQFNYRNLPRLAEVLRQNKTEKIVIELADRLENLPKLSEIVPFLYSIMDYEQYFQVWVKNLPFCVVSQDAVDHILPKDKNSQGEKIKECQGCFWAKRCPGFPLGYLAKYGEEEVCPLPDLPWEVMIEVEPKCNFRCQFCFNKISFAKNGRGNIKNFSTAYVKKIIDGIANSGIEIIRFTGGEPLLRKDIFELLRYAKSKGLEVRLNTNASLINKKTVNQFQGVLDNVLISIESYSPTQEAKITGCPDALEKKITAIELLKKAKIPIVRVGTVITRKNILDFNKIAHFVFSLPVDEWELYRPIPISKQHNLDSRLIKLLVDQLIEFRSKSKKDVFIANALPFCAIHDLNKINSVSKGALYDDGYTRLVVDPRGFVKPDYFLDENLGDPLDILKAWHHPFVKKMRNLKYLPQECHGCPFVFKCQGGSRQAAKIAFGNYQAIDPLAKKI